MFCIQTKRSVSHRPKSEYWAFPQIGNVLSDIDSPASEAPSTTLNDVATWQRVHVSHSTKGATTALCVLRSSRFPQRRHYPNNEAFQVANSRQQLMRDQLTVLLWLCLGAIAQSILFFTAGRYATLPAFVIVLYEVYDRCAMALGWKHNRYMDGVMLKKFSSQLPDEKGRQGSRPADSDVVVLLIGARCNHPLGVLGPGYEQVASFFTSMAEDLDTHAEEFGYLGMTSWLNSADRETGSEVLQVAYFRNVEGLHAFAHSEYHMKGWDWWSRTSKQNTHLSIFHEIYHAGKGGWENIYANSHASGINSITSKFFDEETGRDMWASPVVDANKGVLRTSAGRMGRSATKKHVGYDYDVET